MFMVTKQTEGLGRFLRKDEFKCDFLLLKFESPIVDSSEVKYEIKACPKFESMEMEEFASSRELKSINSKDKNLVATKQLIILKEEKAGLEHQIEEKDEEVKRLTIELDTSNKSIYDKERQLKQEQKERTHQENLLRINRTKYNELIEKMNQKETDLKNAEKTIQ